MLSSVESFSQDVFSAPIVDGLPFIRCFLSRIDTGDITNLSTSTHPYGGPYHPVDLGGCVPPIDLAAEIGRDTHELPPYCPKFRGAATTPRIPLAFATSLPDVGHRGPPPFRTKGHGFSFSARHDDWSAHRQACSLL